MWLEGQHAPPSFDDAPRVGRRSVSQPMEAKSGSSDHSPRLFRAPLGYGEAYWARSAREGIENNGGTGNPETAKATEATTNIENWIGDSRVGLLTMPEVGADRFLVYGFTAMIAHVSISLW